MKLQYSLLFVLVLGQKKEGPGSSLFGCLLYFYNMQDFLFCKKRQNILFFYIISVAPFTNFLNAFSPFRPVTPFFSIHMFSDGSTGSFARTMQANDFPYSIPAFTVCIVPLFSSHSTTTILSDSIAWILSRATNRHLSGLVPVSYSLTIHPPFFETSTRLKSRDSRTCKQTLEEDSGFTAAGEPLQVYPRETDGQSFRHGLVHGFA